VLYVCVLASRFRAMVACNHTLMDELVEGVLPVGAGLAPHDGPGVVFDPGAIFSDGLSIGLHVPLGITQTQRSYRKIYE